MVCITYYVTEFDMLKSFHLDVTLHEHVFKPDKNSRIKQNQAYFTSNHSLQSIHTSC